VSFHFFQRATKSDFDVLHRGNETVPYPLTTRSRGRATRVPATPSQPLLLLVSTLSPLSSPCETLSSSDSSDYSLPPYRNTAVMSSSKTGRCEQPATNKPPLLTPGDLTPEALQAWEMGCRRFFRQKDVAERDQVGRVAWNLQEPRVQDWYISDYDRLNALSFAEFMQEVRSYWLPSDWVAVVRQKMWASTQGEKPFHVWAAEIQSQNVLLHGDPSHLSDERLCYYLESHMHADLLADYRLADVAAEKDLCKWIEKVRLLDEKRLRDILRQKGAVEAALRASNRRPLQASHMTNVRSRDTKAAAEGKTRVHLPPLTKEERKLLQDNSGCFKCCRFFQNHTTPTCPNDFPEAKGYTTLTAADVETARTKQRAKLTTVVVDDGPAPKRIWFVEETTKPIVAAMPSAVLGNGSESGDECVAHFSVPHYRWSCLLDGPNVASSLPVESLIDDSSHLVLTDAALVS